MPESSAELIARLGRTVPDFPRPGIQFLDLTPVFADATALATLADDLIRPFQGRVDVVAGVEARGFALGAAVAARHGLGLLLVRKAGKLPGERIAESYALEYGEATLEVHVGQLPAGTRVLLVDDVLATGGTLRAARALIERAGWSVAGTAVALEIELLAGRARCGDPAVVALAIA